MEGRLPKYFFQECVPLVVSKLYTKFQQLSLSKTAILQHPYNSKICTLKLVVMIDKDWGGGQFLDFVGDTTVMRGAGP